MHFNKALVRAFAAENHPNVFNDKDLRVKDRSNGRPLPDGIVPVLPLIEIDIRPGVKIKEYGIAILMMASHFNAVVQAALPSGTKRIVVAPGMGIEDIAAQGPL